MPITRNPNPENIASEECDQQICSMDNVHVTEESMQTQTLDNTEEVSSTTVDSDPITETNPTISMDVTEDSATSALPDQAVSCDESASHPSSSTTTNFTNIIKGFQDAFAAFASASCRDSEEEDNQMDVSNSTSEQVAIADSVGSSVAEPLVSPVDDSSQVTTTGESFATYESDAGNVFNDTADVKEDDAFHKVMSSTDPDTDSQSSVAEGQAQAARLAAQGLLGESNQTEAAATSDSVYFIQTTDASGQVITSIIDPNDIPSYSDSVVYKQCMKADGEIETTIVCSGGMAVSQEEPSQEQEAANSGETEIHQGEQIIYAHDISGQLTPIDPIESANDVAPPGKQFVYMQDSTGRIIRTIMDANQTMVPGQQVYYTQSDDGRIITSVMDSAAATLASSEDSSQEQQAGDQAYQQQVVEADTSQEASPSMVDRTSGFNIDNSMSGLSMLAELSHLTAGQASTTPGPVTEQRAASSTDSSNSNDMDEFRPVAMVTRRLASEDGVDSVGSDIAELKVGETDSDSFDQSSLLQGEGAVPVESILGRIVSQMKVEQVQSSCTISRENLFVQWQNLDAMCWMDVVLIMLVYSPTLRPLVNLDPNHELASTLLITLLKANKQAQVLLQNLLKKNNGAVISDAEAGTGTLASIQDPKTSKLVCKENMDEIGKAINILYAMREKIWQGLQPRLRCERGKHNSPVLVLPLLVREKPDIKQMFTMSYRYVFKCEKCSYSQDDRHTKILPSFPAVPEDFNMKEPCFVRNCFECKAPNQRMLMKFDQLQDFVQMHFVKGLPHSRFEDLSFVFNDDLYEVTSVVHYKNSPDHFIAWVRNAPGSTWMECDDLKSVITHYLPAAPSIPPSQVHMVMWERRLTPQHTLVMRDTEDTKLLASLVLTVQQPNAHQVADPETRPSPLPGITGTTTGLATTQALPNNLLSGLTTQALPNNLLSGLMTQNFTPYTSRGRGRARGNRGSLSTRGRPVATATLASKRVNPAVAQSLSPSVVPSPQLATSPQVIRLPLSAFSISRGNLRGSAPAAARYVHVANSSQSAAAASRAGTPSKVLVVRSQGSSSNISAAQLLQLLQQTGAISQVGTRFTTTMSTSAANTANSPASTTSFIIQQDGRITATTTCKDASLSYPTSEQSVETPIETVNTSENSTEQKPSGLTISTLPYSGTRMGTSEQTSSCGLQSSDPETHAAGQCLTETGNAIQEDAPGEQAGTSGQAAAISQQQGRYIQIPNPAGGGMLICMVGMKDGKIVLVPVDKNSQSKLAGQSILKTSSTQAASSKMSIHAAGSTAQMLPASSAGSVLAQLQKQLVQTQTVSSGTTTGPRIITLPATSGNKRIQLITVPRAQTDQTLTKTSIMSSQQVGSNTASSISTSADSRILSQSSNIVIREIKRPEMDNITTLPTSLCSSDLVGSSGQLVSTPAVSLLKDVSARLSTSTNRSSLLASFSDQQKVPESFRYILPGSSTTHILHTGPSGGQTQAGKIFTALSSSGTIIGGQLTPSPGGLSSIGTSTADQGLAHGDSSQATSILTAKPRLSKELDTTEYIPLGSNRGRGRAVRGRGVRGRGRSQLWNSDAQLIAPASTNSQQMSTLADLRQIGAHIIEAGTEAVDGIPVVSIPDYSTSQTEILSAAHSIISEIDNANINQDLSSVLQATEQEATADQGPRVITQSIPSMKVNHGFDILTQGILGSSNTRQPPLQQQARSLLTGVKTTLQSSSSLFASLTETTASSMASTCAVQTIGQAEIETLMQAAQAAARPSEAMSQSTGSQLTDSDFGLDDPLTYNDSVMNGQEPDITEESTYEDEKSMSSQLHPEAEHDMSIDDNQVSAAERYRMPVELFQPDEESPEKAMKEDINRITSGLSPRLFNSGDAPHQQEMDKCAQQQSKDLVQESLSEKSREISSPNNGEHSTEITMGSSIVNEPLTSHTGTIEAIGNLGSLCESASNEILAVSNEVQLSENVSSPRRGRGGRASKRGGRRKRVDTRGPSPVKTTSSYLNHETAASETMVHSRKSPEAISPGKKSSQYSANIEDLATHSLMASSETADKPMSEFTDEDNLVSAGKLGHDLIVSPRKAGRPRGSTKASRGRRKLSSTSTHGYVETVNTAGIDKSSSYMESTPERPTQASSLDKDYLQSSSSIGDIATSLMEIDTVARTPFEELKAGPSIDDLSYSHESGNKSPRKVGRPRGRPRRRTSSHKDKKQSNIQSADTEVTAHIETNSGVLMSSPESFIHQSSPSANSVDTLPNTGTDSSVEPTSLATQVAASSHPNDGLQCSHLEEAGPNSSLLVKKVGRPKGRVSTSKREGTVKSCSTSESAPQEENSTCLLDCTLNNELSPQIKCVEIVGSQDEIVQHSSSHTSLVTDSIIETDDIRPKEASKGETPDVLEDSQEEKGHDTNMIPKKASRSRGRPKGSSARTGGRWKSICSSVPEPEATIDTCPSDRTVRKQDGVLAEVSNPERESLQLSPSTDPMMHPVLEAIRTGDGVTDSLIGSTEIIPETCNGGDNVASLLENHQQDEVQVATDLSPQKAAVPAECCQSGSDTMKSDGNSIQETCPSVSSTNICSTHSPNTGQAQSQITTNEEVGTNLLKECDNIAADRPTGALKNARLSDISQIISTRTPISPTASEDKTMRTLSASPYYKKKVNWDVSSSPVNVLYRGSSCSSKMVLGRSTASHTRHASLGPRQEFYTSPPSPLPPCRSHKGNSPNIYSPALVIRKRPKLELMPNADSAKLPTVFPLTVKDAACTGGSVVTSPSGRKMFTGVVVDHKHAKADWSCSVSEPEELLEYVTDQELKTANRKYCKQLLTVFYMEAGDFSSAFGESSKYQQTEASETKEEMPASPGDSKTGDSCGPASPGDSKTGNLGGPGLLGDSKTGESDVPASPEDYKAGESDVPASPEDYKAGESAVPASPEDYKAGDSDGAVCILDEDNNTQPNKTLPENIKSQERKRPSSSSESSTSSQPAKRVKSVHREESCHVESLSESAHIASVDAPSRTNGIDTEKSPAGRSQSDDQKETTGRPFSFPSPTRRSGRTPIPSKKVLDALEDTPFLSSLKVRRVSSVSSEDTQSGYTSDDMPHKRGNVPS